MMTAWVGEMAYLFVIGGLALLALGGESLVGSAVNLSLRLNLSKLLVGLFVIAMGTSAPELAVGVFAALEGQPDIAVGNVVGSNIANLLLILAIAAFIFPVSCCRDVKSRDLVVLMAVTGLYVWTAGGTYLVGKTQGVFFVGCLAAYVVYAFIEERMRLAPVGTLKQNLETQESMMPRPGLIGWGADLLWLAVAIVALYAGARLLIDGVFGLARVLGVSEAIVSLTVVAVGTSLPELATAIVASVRRHPEFVVSGLVGSNIFNILGVLGITAIVEPVRIAGHFVEFDHWVMLGAAVLIAPVALSENRISRAESVLMLLAYGLYIAYLYGGLDRFPSISS